MPALENERHEMFANEFVKDLNGNKAAIRCGYSPNTARSQASRLLTDANIMARVEELKLERSERTKIDADYVLQQAVKLHERCMQEVSPFTNRKGEHIHDEDGNPLYVFDAKGAAAGLRIIGDHINVQAFKTVTKNEITGANGGPLVTREMSAEEAADAYKDLMG